MCEAGFGRDGSDGGGGGSGVQTGADGIVTVGGAAAARRRARGGAFGRGGRDAARFARPVLPRGLARAERRFAGRFFVLRFAFVVARRRFFISFLRRFASLRACFASFFRRLRSFFSAFFRFFFLPIGSSAPGFHCRRRNCRG